MKTALSATALILSLTMGAAHADSRDHGRQHHGNEQHHTRDHHENAHAHRGNVDRHAANAHRSAHLDNRRQHDHDRWHRDYRAYDFHPTHRFHAAPYYRPHGYAPHIWRHGEYLPRAYYAPRYVLDYRVYGLRQPPHGYHWVRVDGDVMLAAITTGLIVGAVYNVF